MKKIIMLFSLCALSTATTFGGTAEDIATITNVLDNDFNTPVKEALAMIPEKLDGINVEELVGNLQAKIGQHRAKVNAEAKKLADLKALVKTSYTKK